MHIIKIHAIEWKDDCLLNGDAVIADTNGQECHVEWSLLLDGPSYDQTTSLDFTINGFELGFNDRWVEDEDEYGHVCTEYDPAKKQYVPVTAETVFVSDEDYDLIHDALDTFAVNLLDKAEEAARDAHLAVINAAREEA